MLTLVNFA